MTTILSFISGPVATNCYLLIDEEKGVAAVIDAPMGGADEIAVAAKERGVVVEKILLTHSHWDHIIDVAEMARRFSAPVYVHRSDLPNVEKPGSDRLFLPLRFEGHSVEHPLSGGEEIEVGSIRLEVVHTPGHTPGGVCFYDRKGGILFSGDTLFAGSIGRLDLPTSDASQMWLSLAKLAKLPSTVRVYPGHGGETTIGKESWLGRAKEIFGG